MLNVDEWIRQARTAVQNAQTRLQGEGRTLGRCTQPESFEKAVCEAFGALGFVAAHHGGIGAPDGVLEAPLGPLAFRTIRRMQDGAAGRDRERATTRRAREVRDAYKAQFAVLVGPALSVDSTFESEMQVHAVSVWTVDDQ